MRWVAVVCIASISPVFFSACSTEPKRLKVTGTLLNNGKPLKVDAQTGVTIVLVPIARKGDNLPAAFDNDQSTFLVQDRGGKGVPPGKYRVSVQFMSLNPTAQMQQWNALFGEENSSIVCEIKGDQALTVDLAQPKKN